MNKKKKIKSNNKLKRNLKKRKALEILETLVILRTQHQRLMVNKMTRKMMMKMVLVTLEILRKVNNSNLMLKIKPNQPMMVKTMMRMDLVTSMIFKRKKHRANQLTQSHSHSSKRFLQLQKHL